MNLTIKLLLIRTLFILISSLGIAIAEQKNQATIGSNLNEQQAIQDLESKIKNMKYQILVLQQQKTNSSESSSFTTYSSKVNNNGLNSFLSNKRETSEVVNNINEDNSIINLRGKSIGGIFSSSGGINVGNAPAITTQGEVTFLGAYSGSNSIPIGMISSSLFASTLIGQRGKFDDYGIFFGGKLEADAQSWFGSSGISNASTTKTYTLPHDGQNIYLTAAKLFFLSNIGHYVTAQFDFDTDETGGFGLGNAFVIFGNLDTSPFFVTAGRNKLSVGTFGGGGPWTGGTISFLAPGKATNVSINYKNSILNANVAVFGSNDNQANFSTAIFYADKWTDNLAAGFNTGYVYNVAGAGNGSFKTFLANQNDPSGKIGSYNINGNLTYAVASGFLNIGAGWATTTNKENFDGNNQNVLAGGWYSALNYSLVLRGRNTNFGASYGQTYNAKDIPMALTASPLSFGKSPIGIQRQLLLSSQRAYFDNNVLMGLEYSYQQLYNKKHMNTITLDLSVYI
ncbi:MULTISPECIES: rhizoferrin import outer membrane protein FslE [unclassified Francisella]|uniref:rhizoferrin import outer membrane protein FslE n=1 Tax=unclassified Francisella TaxID=2610885 RepID=UPI002E3216BD|nr:MULTISPECIES: rhizoferrin import outer membrane protein FslE [unclassified Francisella]MED7818943.1 rhizoferrin import outer membrane protein FslE [Francisella sp. 19S2-4]MED7829780.1 rhizoferrin import outer membrane protein FslE [Francisella sp. 19S2-10]